MINQPALKTLLGWSALLAALSWTSSTLWARDKTDVVTLTNGDRVTGEIKELARGKLRLSTDLMGTVEIEWEGIQQLSSTYRFEVEEKTGARHFGSIRSGAGREIEVVGELASVELDHLSVVRIYPIEKGLSRLEGFLDVGFSFTRANRVVQWSLGAEVRSRTPKRQFKGTFSSLLSDQQDLDRSTRNVLGLSFNHFFGDRWFASALAQFTQNEELELDLRSIVGGGLGRHLIQTTGASCRCWPDCSSTGSSSPAPCRPAATPRPSSGFSTRSLSSTIPRPTSA
ncbi:MAG: DUF481 domain-containing protein [Acidobacteriota bacterium]